MIPPTELAAIHMDPPEPVPGAGDGMSLADFPGEAIDAMVGAVGPGTDSPLVSIEVRHLGGAAARRDGDHGALAAVDAGFSLYAVGMAANAEMKQAVEQRLDQVQSALAPWDAGRILNFADRSLDVGRLFTEETYGRLREVKARYDPDNLIQANHEIPPEV